ncbi:alpha-galactosidase precursor [Pelomyxa schiedti]|nr:alpha-galactosidase precursor [Pelomyxa schiedti]
MRTVVVLIAACCGAVYALNNGLGLTPQMGWNSWNHFGCDINEDLIKGTIDQLVSTGLAAAGYKYVNLDDCWQTERTADGTIVADPVAFPSGIQALADYAHSKGLKFGLYSDAGKRTCAGRPGSLGYETQDAKTYASWGVDYLKYDNCYSGFTDPQDRYPLMRDALNITGRPIFYSICEWGIDEPASWADQVGNSWRTTFDISDNWLDVMEIMNRNNNWADYAYPGAWNDPDMLEVGNGGMTDTEYQSHFSLWAVVKAPLIIGCDITAMSNATFDILTAQELIAVNQDPLGEQARRVAEYVDTEVWSGALSGGKYVGLLLNKGLVTRDVEAKFSLMGMTDTTSCIVRDLWAQQNVGVFTGHVTFKVPSHGVVVISLTPL